MTEQPMIRARIIEVLDEKQKTLLGDFHFVQLPISNDKLVIANRRGSYDSMRVLYSAQAPELMIYVRWIRQMNTRQGAESITALSLVIPERKREPGPPLSRG